MPTECEWSSALYRDEAVPSACHSKEPWHALIGPLSADLRRISARCQPWPKCAPSASSLPSPCLYQATAACLGYCKLHRSVRFLRASFWYFPVQPWLYGAQISLAQSDRLNTLALPMIWWNVSSCPLEHFREIVRATRLRSSTLSCGKQTMLEHVLSPLLVSARFAICKSFHRAYQATMMVSYEQRAAGACTKESAARTAGKGTGLLSARPAFHASRCAQRISRPRRCSCSTFDLSTSQPGWQPGCGGA